MHSTAVRYTLVFVIPIVVALSLAAQSAWSFGALLFVFGLLPAIEMLTTPDAANLSAAEEAVAKADRTYDLVLYSLVPIQWALLGFFLWQVTRAELGLVAMIGLTTAMGVACGVLGINAAHELGHRARRAEQRMSKLLLLSTLYMHFFIEHNRGHHRNVSTDDDPASSRYGEALYPFFLRTIVGSWRSAWALEATRLRREGLSPWSMQNEMIQYQLLQGALVLAIGAGLGLTALVAFLGAAFIGILLLETVNYIEHYGLRRSRTTDGYERTMPWHSWNSNYPLGRLVLLELTRHSDHHYLASRKYQVLRHFDDSPQLPAGYPAMMLLACLPPLWFRVMHHEIAQLDSRGSRRHEARGASGTEAVSLNATRGTSP